ncbi:MAG: hypothetical protein KBD47_00980 [Candidatus Pacebacteria bacterium]|nr:hypothetical protein [Candidatus Paceibacterota bacterium]
MKNKNLASISLGIVTVLYLVIFVVALYTMSPLLIAIFGLIVIFSAISIFAVHSTRKSILYLGMVMPTIGVLNTILAVIGMVLAIVDTALALSLGKPVLPIGSDLYFNLIAGVLYVYPFIFLFKKVRSVKK